MLVFKSHVKQFSMCSTRDRFVLNVRLTASKNQIQGKLDFYSETASHVSSGFSPLQTKGPPAYSKSGAVTSNICWECGGGAQRWGAATHCPPLTSWEQEELLQRRAPNKWGFNNNNGNKRVSISFRLYRALSFVTQIILHPVIEFQAMAFLPSPRECKCSLQEMNQRTSEQ